MKRKSLFFWTSAVVFLVIIGLGIYYIIQKLPPPLEEKISVGGKIVKIEESVIWLETSYTDQDGNIVRGEVRIKVSKDTELAAFVPALLNQPEIPEEELYEEMEDSYIMEEKEIVIEDLKVGDWIEAISERNVRNLKEFTANRIEIFPD
jgi:hypothetical protein